MSRSTKHLGPSGSSGRRPDSRSRGESAPSRESSHHSPTAPALKNLRPPQQCLPDILEDRSGSSPPEESRRRERSNSDERTRSFMSRGESLRRLIDKPLTPKKPSSAAGSSSVAALPSGRSPSRRRIDETSASASASRPRKRVWQSSSDIPERSRSRHKRSEGRTTTNPAGSFDGKRNAAGSFDDRRGGSFDRRGASEEYSPSNGPSGGPVRQITQISISDSNDSKMIDASVDKDAKLKELQKQLEESNRQKAEMEKIISAGQVEIKQLRSSESAANKQRAKAVKDLQDHKDICLEE